MAAAAIAALFALGSYLLPLQNGWESGGRVSQAVLAARVLVQTFSVSSVAELGEAIPRNRVRLSVCLSPPP